jgi:hypothetical protein
MRKFSTHVRVTNDRYTFSVPIFDVSGSNWHVAAMRAVQQALKIYKKPRGRSERPVSIDILLYNPREVAREDSIKT